MKVLKILFNLIYWFVVLTIVLVAGMIVLSKLNTPLGFRVFNIGSGSMEPTLHVGSLVGVKSSEKYAKDDIITYFSERSTQETRTHRVMEVVEDPEVKTTKYITKGDSNEEIDKEPIPSRRVIGKVFFNIPYLGYVSAFAQSQMGFIAVVVIPATIVILMEFMDLKKHIKLWFEQRKQKKDNTLTKVEKATILLIFLSLLFHTSIGSVLAYYADTELSEDNYFQATDLDMGLRSSQDNFIPYEFGIYPGNTVERDIYVQKLGTLPFEYGMEYEYESGDIPLCEELQLSVWYYWYDTGGSLQESLKYEGDLPSFSINMSGGDPDMINPNSNEYFANDTYGEHEQWYFFEITLPEDADASLSDNECNFNIRVDAWQEGHSYSVAFNDTEKLSNSVTTEEWFNNVLRFTSYSCPSDAVIGENNRPDANGDFDIPAGCTPSEGNSLGYIFEAGKEDYDPPWPGLGLDTTPFTPFADTTNAGGELSIEYLDFYGRYDLAQLDASGDPIDESYILGFLCYGNESYFENNYEMVFIPDKGITYCSLFNNSEQAASEGDVVINEIMWMGSSGNPEDEWLELRNMTSSSIDLTGWQITGAGAGTDSIELSGTLAADGYLLISNFNEATSAISVTPDLVISDIDLDDSGELLVLLDVRGVSIDETPSGAWDAGNDGDPEKQSMERNDDVTSGWHTCVDGQCNDDTYWDIHDGDNYGTPGGVNHSENETSITPSPEESSEVSEEPADTKDDKDAPSEEEPTPVIEEDTSEPSSSEQLPPEEVPPVTDPPSEEELLLEREEAVIPEDPAEEIPPTEEEPPAEDSLSEQDTSESSESAS